MKQVGARSVWSISEITLALLRRLEHVPSVWVEAEVTNLGRRGQQVYFTLLDHSAADPHQIEASMNAVVFDRLPVAPGDGSLVHAYGRVEFWRQRSQVRFRVQRVELAGDGLLLARIEELKRRLAEEGLTADARKQPLPLLPRAIGLVTSGEGAARADFLRNVRLRFPAARIVVVRSLVQGDSAPRELVRSIRYLDRQAEVDVIVLARGGGALEDLMAFNSEAVCREVARAATPIVSAVGHETDVTVCDLVADLRVSTPTKAAEAVVPDAAELVVRLGRAEQALSRSLRGATARGRQRLDDLASRLVVGLRVCGQVATARSAGLAGRLDVAIRVGARRASDDLASAGAGLERAIVASLGERRARLDRLADMHLLLSPTRTVSRGYAIVRAAADARVIADAAATSAGEELSIEFRDGKVGAVVTSGGEGV